MATQQDVQDLLRLFTSRKVPIMEAMKQVKALQAVGLRRHAPPNMLISQIAEAAPSEVETALKDAKSAKSLQTACKAHVKKQQSGSTSPQKRPLQGAQEAAGAKRIRSQGDPFLSDFTGGGPSQLSPQELEASLELPLSLDEDRIRATVLQTNRAPVVLAFAVELLRYTMPEQPLSSRLSLAQAVVSANSRSKAVSLGLEKGLSADAEGWGEGQPRVKVMGREVAVLKRSGYEWRGDEEIGEAAKDEAEARSHREAVDAATGVAELGNDPRDHATSNTSWSVSQPVSLKSSTFVARAVHLTDGSQRSGLLRSLFEASPSLATATHNAWAYRVRPSGTSTDRIREESFDDGETGCGDFMLRVMRESDCIDTLVVMSRWFGGILLGPDRWRLMRNCVTSALAERLRRTGTQVALGGEAVWGLDLEGMKAKSSVGGYGSGTRAHDTTGVVGMVIHRPEAARNYILKGFATASQEDNNKEEGEPSGDAAAAGKPKKSPKKTHRAMDLEKEENLGLLLGALRLLFDSWADHLTAAELDSRAWNWYCDVRPEVDVGPSGWGAKGVLRLGDLFNLRRKSLERA